MRTSLALLVASSVVTAIRIVPQTEKFEMLMPHSKPTEPETYLCTPVILDENNTYYIGKCKSPNIKGARKISGF